MNIRQAIFVSVASAGVVASSWFGGPAATAQASAPPAHVRLGAAHLGAATAASGTRATAAGASGTRATAAGASGTRATAAGASGTRATAAGASRPGTTATAASRPGTTAAADSGPDAAARRGGPVLLSPLSRGQLRSGAALQLVSSPAYPAAAYPDTLQAVLDRAHR